MRSRMEAAFAAGLDAKGWTWEYEPRAFADETGQYLPDFLVHLKAGYPPLFIEVKPTLETAQNVLPRMQIIWSSEPTAILRVETPHGWYAAFGGRDRRWHWYEEA